LIGLAVIGCADAEVLDLRCEYQVNPLGIDTARPHLSWRIESEERGYQQSAYQILVASSAKNLTPGNADVWDSGKVESDQSQLLPFQGQSLESAKDYYWKVRVWNRERKASGWSPHARWTTGLLRPEDWQASWIGPPFSTRIPNNVSSPHFRKDFNLKSLPDRALFTLHSPAYFEVYVNGRKVDENVLAPAVSDTDKRAFSITYDIGPFLRKGKNCIGVWTGIGWAEEVTFRAQLNAVTEGQTLVIGTDASWKTKQSGYYKRGDRTWGDFGGEFIDAREWIPNWCDPTLDTTDWDDARIMDPLPGSVLTQPCPKNVIRAELKPVSVTEIASRTYEIDFGKAITGRMRMELRGLRAGRVIKVTYADRKEATPSSADEHYAHFGGAYYQDFNQSSQYVTAGTGKEVFENRFSYAGFRYVVVEGIRSEPQPADFTAKLIESDLEPAGSFESSNDLFNRIHEVNRWTQRCLNLGGYYVDCPTRERRAYGDAMVALQGFMTNFRADGFYRKWAGDWRTVQQPDGFIKHTAPWGIGGGGPAWGGCLSAVTWTHYLYYGDERMLEENYESIRRYVEWLESKCENGVLKSYGGRWSFLGDWVPPRRGMDTQNWPDEPMRELFNSCFHVWQMDLLRQMAAVLGKEDDERYYAQRLSTIRPQIHETFYDEAYRRYVIDEQAYYIMPLLAGVVPESERAAVLDNLENNILIKNQGHLDTGMMGTYFMMEYLRQIGRNDLVFAMFEQETYPSWGHKLKEGATTMWEQWNGYFSQIHSCFTSPDNWFYQGLAGITADPKAPGFKNVIIKPAVVGDVTWVKAHHDSPYGRIESHWERKGRELTMNITIPANSSATVYVPAGRMEDVTIGGKQLEDAKGAEFMMQNGCAVIQVGSGRYQFSSEF
jgi:alpha-L-rhamnosidase